MQDGPLALILWAPPNSEWPLWGPLFGSEWSLWQFGESEAQSGPKMAFFSQFVLPFWGRKSIES